MTSTEDAQNRLDLHLQRAREMGKGALLPYITAGYPDLEASAELIRRLDRPGVAAVELGFPFSDSIADGPVIQDSFNRVLGGGISVDGIFETVAAVRDEVNLALVAMCSVSLVRYRGFSGFAADARQAGFDGLIVPDVPLEEAQEAADAAGEQGLGNVMLVAASTPPDRAAGIARMSTGFVYLVAARGTTGERDELPADLQQRIESLRAAGGRPVCVGFGISTAAHVQQVCRFADGAIVGSAIVRRITEGLEAGDSREVIVDKIDGFVSELAGGAGEDAGG